MGIFLEIGDMQGDLIPDPDKPLTFESLVEQYGAQARKACADKGWREESWRMLAEIWAQTDIDIFRDMKAIDPSLTNEQLLRDIQRSRTLFERLGEDP